MFKGLSLRKLCRKGTLPCVESSLFLQRYNLSLDCPRLFRGARKQREVPAYVVIEQHVHHAGHDRTLVSAVQMRDNLRAQVRKRERGQERGNLRGQFARAFCAGVQAVKCFCASNVCLFQENCYVKILAKLLCKRQQARNNMQEPVNEPDCTCFCASNVYSFQARKKLFQFPASF